LRQGSNIIVRPEGVVILNAQWPKYSIVTGPFFAGAPLLSASMWVLFPGCFHATLPATGAQLIVWASAAEVPAAEPTAAAAAETAAVVKNFRRPIFGLALSDTPSADISCSHRVIPMTKR
jgi:hypothetical protein